MKTSDLYHIYLHQLMKTIVSVANRRLVHMKTWLIAFSDSKILSVDLRMRLFCKINFNKKKY